MKILFAEDTHELNRAVTYLLEHEQYEVDSVFNGEEALSLVKQNGYDCIVLDIMMPKMDGLTVLQELRACHIVTPVLLLTARSEIEDRVTGLDAGADDYLPKPFASKELMARIRALLRRRFTIDKRDIRVGNLVLNTGNFVLSAANSMRLSSKEFELILILMSNPNADLSTEFLLEQVWGKETGAQEDTLWLYISYLRRKLMLINADVTIVGTKGGSFRLLSSADFRS